jgi:hypothetical protein
MNMVPEKTIEECKRHVDECAAPLERTTVPEYREAIISMAKAWMKNRRASEDQSKSLTSFCVLRSSNRSRASCALGFSSVPLPQWDL